MASSRRAPSWTPVALAWTLPVVIGLVVLGPALRPGGLFNLDLVVPDQLEVPRGFWGLGPELPRRLPFWIPISLASGIVPAPLIVKAVMVTTFAVAWVGMARLLRGEGRWWGHVAGALYAFSPFMLTRSAVGHLMITVPAAVLPWVLLPLLHPGRRLSSTFLAGAALAVGGHFGGSLALVVGIVGVAVVDRRRALKGLLTVLAAQAVWLVPGIAVALTSAPDVVDGSPFPTSAPGLSGALRLSAGGGFWNTPLQVGGAGVVEAVVGAALLALAVIGTRALPEPLRRPLTVLGVTGWLLAWVSAAGWARGILDAATGNPIGAIWREGHRLLVLHLLWLAPASALGARDVSARLVVAGRRRMAGAVAAIPAGAAVALALPGLWGFGGQLRATDVPDGWTNARRIIAEQSGTVLALPWHLYFNLDVGDGTVRRVLNPLPLVLGGDVLASSETGLEIGGRERADPREPAAAALVDRLRSNSPIAVGLAELGVRWVALIPNDLAGDYAALARDPGLRLASRSDGLVLFEVLGWMGPTVTDGGDVVRLSGSPPFWAPPAGAGLTWNRAGAGGWRRGWSPGSTTAAGTLTFGPGSGPIWNLATPPSVLAQFSWLVAVVATAGWIAHGRRRINRSEPVDYAAHT